MYLTIYQALIGVAALAFSFVLWRIVDACFFSPLRSIPGPFLAKLTGKWLIMVDLAGVRSKTIDDLHKQYGSAVRVGPNEVAFSNDETIQELYSQQTQFTKAPCYDEMSVKPLGVFSLRDRNAHNKRRRLLSHAFSQGSLNNIEPLIKRMIEKLLARVELSLSQPVDMFSLFRCLSLDIVGELFLGQTFGALDLPQHPQFLRDMDMFFINLGVKGSFPAIHSFIRLLPIPAVQHMVTANESIVEYGRKAFYKYIDQHGRQSKRRDLLTKILDENPEKSDELQLTDLEAYTEVSNMIFAGTDTTSTTLTYTFWELSKNPAWQDKLRQELLPVIDSKEPIVPKYSNIVDLPILDAVINESLRLHPAAPASLQRETPAGGRTIDSYFIPEGVSITGAIDSLVEFGQALNKALT